MKRARDVALALGLVWSMALGASAQDGALPRTAAVMLPDCPLAPIAWETVLAQLELELRGMNVRLRRRADGTENARIGLVIPDCDPEARELRVSVASPSVGMIREREIALPGAAASGRERIVALAIAEALRDLWPRLVDLDARLRALEAAQATDAERDGDDPAARRDGEPDDTRALLDDTRARVERLEQAVTARPPRALLQLLAAVWSHPGAGVALLGPRLSLDVQLGPLRVVLDVDGGVGIERTSLGDVTVAAIRGGAGLFAPYTAGALLLSFGVAVRVGWARAEGHPFAAGVTGLAIEGATVSPVVRAMLSAPVAGPVRFVGDFEAGWGFGGVDGRVGDTRVVALDGPLLGIAIGAAVAL